MADYIIKRLLQGILVVLAVSIILFAIMQMMPGDPILLICGDRVSPEIQVALYAFAERIGVAAPIFDWRAHRAVGGL